MICGTQIPVSVGNNLSIQVKEVPKATTPTTTNNSSSTPKKTTIKKTSNKKTTKITKSSTDTAIENTIITNQVAEDTQAEEQLEVAPNALISIDRKGVTTLRDIASDVMIKALPIAIESETILEVKEIDEEDEDYDKIIDILRKVDGDKKCYTIQLLKNNEVINPNGYVTVFIPIPEEYNKDRVELYCVNEEDESYKLITGKIQEDYFTFTTDNLSTYVLVEEPEPIVETAAPTYDSEQMQIVNAIQKVIEFFTNITVLYCIIGILLIIIFIMIIKRTRRPKGY